MLRVVFLAWITENRMFWDEAFYRTSKFKLQLHSNARIWRTQCLFWNCICISKTKELEHTMLVENSIISNRNAVKICRLERVFDMYDWCLCAVLCEHGEFDFFCVAVAIVVYYKHCVHTMSFLSVAVAVTVFVLHCALYCIVMTFSLAILMLRQLQFQFPWNRFVRFKVKFEQKLTRPRHCKEIKILNSSVWKRLVIWTKINSASALHGK